MTDILLRSADYFTGEGGGAGGKRGGQIFFALTDKDKSVTNVHFKSEGSQKVLQGKSKIHQPPLPCE